MNKNDLSRIIEETILEMLEEGDESLIGLMMEHEKNFNGEDTDRETFITETISALKTSLGVIVEEVSEEDSQLISEQRKMLTLVEYLDTGDENVLREEKKVPDSSNHYAITKKEWDKIHNDYKIDATESRSGVAMVFAGSLPDRLKAQAKKNGDTGTTLVPIKVKN